MKQFGKILKFELKNYLANKIFASVTIILALVIAIVMFFPRIKNSFSANKSDTSTSEKSVMLIYSPEEYANQIENAFENAFTDYDVKPTNGGLESVKKSVKSGDADCAFVIDSLDSYTYFVDNLSMYDNNTAVADEVLQNLYRISEMVKNNISPDDAQRIMSAQIHSNVETLGVDQMQNYWYTYIMIFALYIVILLYGQMIATNVATEKSSRAMELLITSAKPVNMMFGKVLASCLAGFTQLLVVFGTAFVCFNLNKTYLDSNGIISAMFDMPADLLGYMLVFFVLGFLIYAFLYGAIGSTASKLEDINTSVMPITMIYIAAFLVVMMSLASNTVDTVLMRVCSFIPLTSPMAMFTRIAMSTVPWYEISASIIILVGSVMGVGVLAAKIYRVGVLMYGNAPKLGDILKAIKKS